LPAAPRSSREFIVPTKKRSCELVQQGIAGPAPDRILEAIRAEYWLPASSPQPVARKPGKDSARSTSQTADQGEAMTALLRHARRFRDLADRIPHSVIALLARASIAAIFWRSAVTKVDQDYQVTDLTIALFQDEYLKSLPFLPAAPMAYLATALELAMPALILIGFATRLATLPLIGMALFIQLFVYPTSWPDHLIWFTLLVFLLARGPGAISLDALLARQFDRNGAAMRAGA